jgi:hypothetical protein
MKNLKAFESFENIESISTIIGNLEKKSQQEFIDYFVKELAKHGFDCEAIIQAPSGGFNYFLTIGIVPMIIDKTGIRYDSFNSTFSFPKNFNILKIFRDIKEFVDETNEGKLMIFFNPKLKKLNKTGIFDDY